MTQQHQEKDALSSFGFVRSRHYHGTMEFSGSGIGRR
jgi:hypothetical protein